MFCSIRIIISLKNPSLIARPELFRPRKSSEDRYSACSVLKSYVITEERKVIEVSEDP